MPNKRVLTEEQKEQARARAKAWYHTNKERSSIANAEWRKSNKDSIKARTRSYYLKNKEIILEKQSAYLKRNAEQISAYHAEYRKKNAERIKAYKKANKDRALVIQNNRRARESGRLSSDIVHKLLVLQKSKCANCKKRLSKLGKHLDHIMPLALGGENTDKNTQLLCPTCNLRKRSKHPIEWAQQNGRLL